MNVGEIFRYARPYDPKPDLIDGLPNYFHHAHTVGCKLPLLESGINPIQKVSVGQSNRLPAILISSSPHKIGSAETPWQDFFDPDNGHIRYFGDNKEPGIDPASPPGNRTLLDQLDRYSSPNKHARLSACPVLFFKRVRVGTRTKGNIQFQGFGIIHKAERITQYDRKHDRPFSNYVFDFVTFDMAGENEDFDWKWISARRDSNANDRACLRLAPSSWKRWVAGGNKVLESCRRRVVKLLTFSRQEQTPQKNSREEKALWEIYNYYDGRKARFESLASVIAARIVGKNGHSYRSGWITPASSDHGADFIGRMDIGSGFGQAKVIVLGQAKCEKPTTPTGGNHIARTVARLKRGWIGVYVTTSYFSEAVQREVLEDKFPILLVNGLRLATEAIRLAHDDGFPTITALLDSIDATHESRIAQRDPEEILFE